MPRHYYCSVCGMEIVIKRKALKNKLLVIDLIPPHICDESAPYLDNITDAPKPSRAAIVFNDSLESKQAVQQQARLHQPEYKDLRDKSIIKSSAPPNVLSQLRSLGSTIPERPLVDPDLDDSGD